LAVNDAFEARRVVAFGGGHGLFATLRAGRSLLADRVIQDLTAIVGFLMTEDPAEEFAGHLMLPHRAICEWQSQRYFRRVKSVKISNRFCSIDFLMRTVKT
jgi:hypothetical protein